MDEQVKDDKEVKTEVAVDENQQDASDKLTPDHPRFKQVLEDNRILRESAKELKQRIADIEERVQARVEATGEVELSQEEKVALDRIDKALKQRGFIKKDELESTTRIERQAIEYERLSEKYDGSNGLPKFIADDVQVYAKRNGFSNLEKAYKDMHYDAFVQAEVKRQSSAQKPPAGEKPTGGERQVAGSTYTREQIANMSPEEYAKNRQAILQSLRK